MKKIVLLFLIIVYNGSFAQQSKQWRAIYQYKNIVTEKEKKRRDSLLKAQPEMAKFIKNLYKSLDNRTYYLDFNPVSSVFKQKPKLEPGKNTRFSGFRNRVLYKDLKTKTFKDFRPMFGENFIVTDTLPDYHWKITGETKKIGQFNVMKAIGTEQVKEKNGKKKTEEITAWFSPDIPVGNGPQKYWGLPGLIMELHTGNSVYVLKELLVNPKDKIEIKPPEKGKVLSQEAYEKERKKIFENMRKRSENRRGEKSSDKHIIIRM